MWPYLLQGILFGFAAAAQPGPLRTYIISESLARGWKKSLPAAFAPLVSDGPIIALCLLVLSQVPAWFQKFLYIAGGLFVLYLAYGAYNVWRNIDTSVRGRETVERQSVFKAAGERIQRALIGLSAGALFGFGLYQLWLGMN